MRNRLISKSKIFEIWFVIICLSHIFKNMGYNELITLISVTTIYIICMFFLSYINKKR
jgi:hypothetical protein